MFSSDIPIYIFVFPSCKTVNIKLNYIDIIVDKGMISCTKLKCEYLDVVKRVWLAMHSIILSFFRQVSFVDI